MLWHHLRHMHLWELCLYCVRHSLNSTSPHLISLPWKHQLPSPLLFSTSFSQPPFLTPHQALPKLLFSILETNITFLSFLLEQISHQHQLSLPWQASLWRCGQLMQVIMRDIILFLYHLFLCIRFFLLYVIEEHWKQCYTVVGLLKGSWLLMIWAT